MILSDFSLPGSRSRRIDMATCCKCGQRVTKDGGIELKPGQFTCRGCWRRKAISKQGVNP